MDTKREAQRSQVRLDGDRQLRREDASIVEKIAKGARRAARRVGEKHQCITTHLTRRTRASDSKRSGEHRLA